MRWFEPKSDEDDRDDLLYSLDEAKARFEVRELDDRGWLLLHRENGNEHWLNFAVMQFARSDGDGHNVMMSLVFHGNGPDDTLRECRHTYWGEDGYIFYPDGRLIAAAFKALGEFYDYMV